LYCLVQFATGCDSSSEDTPVGVAIGTRDAISVGYASIVFDDVQTLASNWRRPAARATALAARPG